MRKDVRYNSDMIPMCVDQSYYNVVIREYDFVVASLYVISMHVDRRGAPRAPLLSSEFWRLSIDRLLRCGVFVFCIICNDKDLKGLKEVCSCLDVYVISVKAREFFHFRKKYILCSALIEVTT